MVANFGQAEKPVPKREFDNISRGKAELLWEITFKEKELLIKLNG